MARNCSNQFGHNYPENHGAWSYIIVLGFARKFSSILELHSVMTTYNYYTINEIKHKAQFS